MPIPYSPFERLADLGYDELELIRWSPKKSPRWMIRAIETSLKGVGSGQTPTEAAQALLALIDKAPTPATKGTEV